MGEGFPVPLRPWLLLPLPRPSARGAAIGGLWEGGRGEEAEEEVKEDKRVEGE